MDYQVKRVGRFYEYVFFNHPRPQRLLRHFLALSPGWKAVVETPGKRYEFCFSGRYATGARVLDFLSTVGEGFIGDGASLPFLVAMKGNESGKARVKLLSPTRLYVIDITLEKGKYWPMLSTDEYQPFKLLTTPKNRRQIDAVLVGAYNVVGRDTVNKTYSVAMEPLPEIERVEEEPVPPKYSGIYFYLERIPVAYEIVAILWDVKTSLPVRVYKPFTRLIIGDDERRILPRKSLSALRAYCS